MPLNSKVIGTLLPPLTLDVTPRKALAYAAGIGAVDALDDTQAPLPFLCASLEWQLVIAARNRILGLAPGEAVRAVHAGQATTFHRPLPVSGTVIVSGRIIEVRGTRAGALASTELIVADQRGEPISSTLSTAIYRGVAVSGEDRSVEGFAAPLPAPPLTTEALQTIIPLDRGFAHRYTECANIWNPIHTEREVALAAGLPGIIVHGTALWALAGKILMARFASRRLTSLSGRFAAMVPAGTPITVRHGLGAPHEAAFVVLNHAGEEAVADGRATFN